MRKNASSISLQSAAIGTPRRVTADPRRQVWYELASGLSGAFLALFMWGHTLMVGSILTGAAGFEWVETSLEQMHLARPTVFVVSLLFVIHAITAGRKIPAQLEERRRMRQLAEDLFESESGLKPAHGPARRPGHSDSLLWIWQVRTAAVIIVLGSFHIVLLGLDVLTPVFGERSGIEAATTLARVQAGLWPLYAVLLLCVEFHASVGLYRLAIKWSPLGRLPRSALRWSAYAVLFVFLGLGSVSLAVLANWIAPPLAFLLSS